MPGIYIMALITIAVALAAIGPLILIKSRRSDWRLFAWALVLSLPLAALTFYFVRLPIDGLVRELGLGRYAYLLVSSLYAPVTEEPAKLLPLALPFLYRHLNRDNAVRAGLALGLGFGLGEVGLLAWKVAQSPATAALPWYIFTGFLIERLMVCFLHGAFVATTLWFWFRGRRWGILVAMALHYLLNFPIFLAVMGLFGTDRALFIQMSMLWVVVMTVAMVVLIVFFLAGRKGVKRLVSRDRICPGCGSAYKATLLALNLPHKRYERCPHCRKWHWVPHLAPPKEGD